MLTEAHKKYRSYSVEELLQDDYFVHSMINPTKETDEFWKKAIDNKVIDLHDYKLARYFINSVQVENEKVSNEEKFELWENIEVANKYNLKKKKKRLFFYWSATAGVAALFILLFSLYNIALLPENKISQNGIESIKAPETPVMDIQLVLSDNETVSLEGQEAEITYNKDRIAINNKETELKNEITSSEQSVTYNQLIVPMGKRSMLTFSEGSKIWVNAGTRIVYPTTFDKKKREIFVDGEAFLDVSRDDKCPFIVKTKDLSIKVLGTSFNIMAYEKDSVQNIVLVSGSVKINSSNKEETHLSPNQMYTYSNNSYQVKTVNIEDHILWKSGIYQYNSEALEIILKRLSRYYGKEIKCTSETSLLKCSGKLDLKDDLQLVLEGISKTAPIKYEIIDEAYLITNK
ncbi:hypothetical protein M2459_002804 [Parabacteroides sp. PF5-5]|uniref:FecR family protein n=1 Tax=unclassified Parabacteroides TaxID=2649774 RepID=UPI00247715F3|nr:MULTISPECIES: FecR family protein [unclassified Parabacteroides]MDH6306052.1 hypothetical protein [Parabacteroides sp. PH5-39]MDH6317050.1 hypothetical protein [Parabacteroides sp. PF5-13]MDH6320803.1 hypothetical protein [Parabacteroides sp. PH5-13]MDH6324495.1 hypothetical protein [Parabacteroides sp. PH5-8]MDH6328235.1 hypothetical protein [Parabacteroides sp. PH5-41]